MLVDGVRIIRLRIRQKGPSAVDVVRQPLRARLQQRENPAHPWELVTGQRLPPQAGRLESGRESRQQFFVRKREQVLMVEPVQLLGVEDGVAAADALEREAIDELADRQQLFIRCPATSRAATRKLTIPSGM